MYAEVSRNDSLLEGQPVRTLQREVREKSAWCRQSTRKQRERCVASSWSLALDGRRGQLAGQSLNCCDSQSKASRDWRYGGVRLTSGSSHCAIGASPRAWPYLFLDWPAAHICLSKCLLCICLHHHVRLPRPPRGRISCFGPLLSDFSPSVCRCKVEELHYRPFQDHITNAHVRQSPFSARQAGHAGLSTSHLHIALPKSQPP
jgi:hypothetical protein